MNSSNYEDIYIKLHVKNLSRLHLLRKILTNLATTESFKNLNDSQNSNESKHSYHYYHHNYYEPNNCLVTKSSLSSLGNNMPTTMADREEEKKGKKEKKEKSNTMSAIVYAMLSDSYIKYYSSHANKVIKELNEELPCDICAINIIRKYQIWKDIRETRTFKPFVNKICFIGSLITFTRFVKNKYIELLGLTAVGCSIGFMIYHYYNNYQLVKDEMFALSKLLNTIDKAIIDYNNKNLSQKARNH